MKKFNLILTGLLVGVIIWLLVTLILGVIYQPKYSNAIKVTVNFNNRPAEGTETVETTRQVPVTCPFSGETKTSEVKTVVKTTKSEPFERRGVITEEAFKETMQKVAYAARQEAQNEYDKNFSLLLTILTIFGIAWPVIIALLQFKFNEKEMEKINKAEEKVNELQLDFEFNKKETAGAFALNFESLANAYRSNMNTYANDPANKKIAIINYIGMTICAIARHCEADNIELARQLIMRLYEEQDILGDVDKNDILSIKNVESFKVNLGDMYYEIFKTVYNKYSIQQLP